MRATELLTMGKGDCNGKKIGKCSICGEYTELTFEHVPPKSAGNNQTANFYKIIDINKSVMQYKTLPWNLKKVKYKQQQRGAGYYSLCKQCNNLTGSKYGNAYCEVSNVFSYILSKEKPKVNSNLNIELELKPLNFIKQVLSMFCNIQQAPIENISSFLLSPEKKLDNLGNYTVTMFLNIGVLYPT